VKLPRLAVCWLLLGWLFVVLYPDPSLLAASIRNIRSSGIDPFEVRELAAAMPDDPRLIERIVLDETVPYAFDWEANGVPWYFPTVREVLQLKRGDCESRMIVFASILAAKDIPFTILMSFDHTWVDYPGKQDNALENERIALGERTNDGVSWNWPKEFDLLTELHKQVEFYWTPMPAVRKALLMGGMLLVALINPITARRWRRVGARAPDRLALGLQATAPGSAGSGSCR
jgi:hypothetical protein